MKILRTLALTAALLLAPSAYASEESRDLGQTFEQFIAPLKAELTESDLDTANTFAVHVLAYCTVVMLDPVIRVMAEIEDNNLTDPEEITKAAKFYTQVFNRIYNRIQTDTHDEFGFLSMGGTQAGMLYADSVKKGWRTLDEFYDDSRMCHKVLMNATKVSEYYVEEMEAYTNPAAPDSI